MAIKIGQRGKPASEQLAASVILTGASALRMMRAERRQMGYISWRDLSPDEECRVLRASSPSIEDIYLPDLVRIGAASGEVQEDLCLLVGSAAQRRRMPGVGWSVCSGLPAGSILEVEPGVYSLSPEALCVVVAREVGCIQAFALAQELCSKISLSDRGKYLPPYTSPVTNKLAKDKDQPAGVGYFEVEPVLTPDRLADYLAVCKGNAAKQLQRLCPYLSENLRSPMECIMLALFSLPFSYGGFACGPFKTDYKIEFDDRAQAISGMPHAVCDAYQEAAQFDLEYNGELGHSSRRGRIHDEKRNTGLITMGIEVATVNKRCSATWRQWRRSHGACTSVCESGTGIVSMPAGKSKRRCLTRCGRVLGLNPPNNALKQGVGYMLWPKYSKYEYCYKFSNSKIRDFGTGRWGKLESY